MPLFSEALASASRPSSSCRPLHILETARTPSRKNMLPRIKLHTLVLLFPTVIILLPIFILLPVVLNVVSSSRLRGFAVLERELRQKSVSSPFPSQLSSPAHGPTVLAITRRTTEMLKMKGKQLWVLAVFVYCCLHLWSLWSHKVLVGIQPVQHLPNFGFRDSTLGVEGERFGARSGSKTVRFGSWRCGSWQFGSCGSIRFQNLPVDLAFQACKMTGYDDHDYYDYYYK